MILKLFFSCSFKTFFLLKRILLSTKSQDASRPEALPQESCGSSRNVSNYTNIFFRVSYEEIISAIPPTPEQLLRRFSARGRKQSPTVTAVSTFLSPLNNVFPSRREISSPGPSSKIALETVSLSHSFGTTQDLRIKGTQGGSLGVSPHQRVGQSPHFKINSVRFIYPNIPTACI